MNDKLNPYLAIFLFFAMIYFLLVTGVIKKEKSEESFAINYVNPDRTYMLDDGVNGTLGLHTNMCSQSCCSPQYPTPFPMPFDPLVLNSGEEYVPSNFTCTNSNQNAGCMCLTKAQANFLSSRGGNK